MIPLLLGYLDPEDRILLEKLIGKRGGDSPPLVLNFQGYFGSKLEFRVSYKGGSKMDPPFGSFNKGDNEMEPP